MVDIFKCVINCVTSLCCHRLPQHHWLEIFLNCFSKTKLMIKLQVLPGGKDVGFVRYILILHALKCLISYLLIFVTLCSLGMSTARLWQVCGLSGHGEIWRIRQVQASMCSQEVSQHGSAVCRGQCR